MIDTNDSEFLSRIESADLKAKSVMLKLQQL